MVTSNDVAKGNPWEWVAEVGSGKEPGVEDLNRLRSYRIRFLLKLLTRHERGQ